MVSLRPYIDQVLGTVFDFSCPNPKKTIISVKNLSFFVRVCFFPLIWGTWCQKCTSINPQSVNYLNISHSYRNISIISHKISLRVIEKMIFLNYRRVEVYTYSNQVFKNWVNYRIYIILIMKIYCNNCRFINLKSIHSCCAILQKTPLY